MYLPWSRSCRQTYNSRIKMSCKCTSRDPVREDRPIRVVKLVTKTSGCGTLYVGQAIQRHILEESDLDIVRYCPWCMDVARCEVTWFVTNIVLLLFWFSSYESHNAARTSLAKLAASPWDSYLSYSLYYTVMAVCSSQSVRLLRHYALRMEWTSL